MNNRDYIIILYDYYSNLFNDKQRYYFEEYYFNNLSLQEISENTGISRNAIHKMIKNIENKLYFYEEKLELYKKNQKLTKLLEDSSLDNIKKEISKLFLE
jgi:predicted DNA-binding protein YlxM (UPF0122 family)